MPDLLADYPRAANAYNELPDAQGQVRPHWQRLFRVLQRYRSLAQLNQRQALLERQIQENGVTYNVHADLDGLDRQWALDLLPNLIPADEWQQIAWRPARRVAQSRAGGSAAVLSAIAARRAAAGPSWCSDNNFGPAMACRYPVRRLHPYAVDLARAPDGRWWVLADRTQTPSGAGYALEKPARSPRASPELYRDLRVQHLSGFFRSLQEFLRREAPQMAKRRWWYC